MTVATSATSNEVIGTLACLLSFEVRCQGDDLAEYGTDSQQMSRCSTEALTHLHGLRSIINMKGGIEALASPELTNMLDTYV